MSGERVTWVSWQGATVAHAASVDPRDVRVGSFPLACGRWAPDAWDVSGDGVYCAETKGRCRRCTAAVNRNEEV